MANFTCLAENDPARIYAYCPSLPAAVLFAILFAFSTLAFTIRSVSLRFRPAWVLIMAGLWELIGYILRSVSISQQANSGIYTAQFMLILLAPLWINAFVYMVFGRMVHFFILSDRVIGIRARRITIIFVLFDITAFIVQLVGGLMTSGTDIPLHTVQLGLNIYTGGVALQLAFIGTFLGLTLRFRHLLKTQDSTQHSVQDTCRGQTWIPASPPNTSDNSSEDDNSKTDLIIERGYTKARPLLRILWIALSLIIIRNIYRLTEYGMGGATGNTITRHEWYQYVFDAVPMLFAISALCVFHPGKIIQGYRSDFSEEDKARKEEKRAKKAEKKTTKMMEKRGKKGLVGTETIEKVSADVLERGDAEASR